MEPAPHKGMRILIVDDMPKNIQVLGTILRERGYLVSIAQSGLKALESIEQKKPDLVILDIVMPEMDGFETCARLKNNPETKDIPVIFMSALTETVDKVRGFKEGAVDYLTKPTDPEELLARINTHLTIKELQVDLKNAKEEAEAANAAKGDFLARMSHEIRTPMNAVIGLSHLLSQTDLTDKQLDYLKKIQASSHVLTGVINDILDFSRMEAGMLEMDWINFNLHEILENVSSIMSVGLEEKAIEFLFDVSSDVPRFLVGDPLRLEQVLINLVGNAVKFTESGEIIVSVESVLTERSRAELLFKVKDTGIGIEEDKVKGLFSAFSQGDKYMTRQYGGSGLGLAICKRLVEMMGGDISVTSTPGVGSTFIFNTVLGHQQDVDETALKPPGELSGLRVLLVDDSPTTRHIIKNLLDSFSFKTTFVSSGQAALDELGKNPGNPEKGAYDLVIMDWRMPGMNGVEASLKIKEFKGLVPRPKILMLTAFDKESVVSSAEKAGIDGFLTKPVTPSILLRSIIEIMGRTDTAKGAGFQKKSKLKTALEKIRGAKVLIVEDNPVNQLLAKKLLQHVDLTVSVSSNGLEALDEIEKNHYDAVLMDIQMPVMDGYEATRQMRSRLLDIPIIAMTAHAMDSEREKCLESGMNDYLTKPVNPEHLYMTLLKWIDESPVA